MSAKWTGTIGGEIHEWSGYVIERHNESLERWWVVQGEPTPYRNRFEYINDAKEACETARLQKLLDKIGTLGIMSGPPTNSSIMRN